PARRYAERVLEAAGVAEKTGLLLERADLAGERSMAGVEVVGRGQEGPRAVHVLVLPGEEAEGLVDPRFGEGRTGRPCRPLDLVPPRRHAARHPQRVAADDPQPRGEVVVRGALHHRARDESERVAVAREAEQGLGLVEGEPRRLVRSRGVAGLAEGEEGLRMS